MDKLRLFCADLFLVIKQNNYQFIYKINIAGLGFHHTEKIIYDIFGRHLLHSKSSEIDISQLPNGLYVMKILDDSGAFSQKFSVLRE